MLLNIHKCIAQSGWLTILHLHNRGRQGKASACGVYTARWKKKFRSVWCVDCECVSSVV